MRKSLFVIAALAAVCLSIAASAAEWPQWMGPTANGFAPDLGINKNWNQTPPKTLWKSPMSCASYGGMCVAGGKVFVVDRVDAENGKDVIRAIDISTGKDAWTYSYSDNERDNFGWARSTPTYDKGRVYTMCKNGVVNCLDAKTGTVVWTRDLEKEFGGRKPNWEYCYSIVIDKNKLIVLPGGEKAGIAALDKMTGKTIWQNGSNIPSYATPVLAKIMGKPQYVIFDTVGLQGIDPATGAQLWSFPWKTGAECNAATPIVMGDSIFIATGYGHGCAMVDITAEGAKSRWENKDMMAHFSSPIFYKGYIYGTGDPGNLMCMDPKDGKVLWKKEGFEKGALVGVDGVMLVMDGKGGDCVMVKLAPDSYQELGRFKPLGDQSWTMPVVSNGKLFVRNKASIACIALK